MIYWTHDEKEYNCFAVAAVDLESDQNSVSLILHRWCFCNVPEIAPLSGITFIFTLMKTIKNTRGTILV